MKLSEKGCGRRFDGTDPNGTWKLFVVDDAPGATGQIGSWTLVIKARVTV